MLRFFASTLDSCRPKSFSACCFVALLLSAVLITPASGQDVTVWVDFTSDFNDGSDGSPNGVADWIDQLNIATDDRGVNDFSAAERQTIEATIVSELERVYAKANLIFVTSQPSVDHDVIYMGPNSSSTSSLGVAQGDVGNRNTNTYAEAFPNGDPNTSAGGVARVFTGNFGNHIGFGGSREASVQGLANALAGTAAHELGHTYGLKHHFVYSAAGISSGVDTGGLQTQHIISTGSTGNSIAIRIAGERTLSPFSEVMIDIAGGSRFYQQFSFLDNDTLVDFTVMSDNSEQGGADAGDTNETAQALTFATGTFSGKDISYVEADLDGGSGDVDRFSFDISFETVLSTHVFSESLAIGNDRFNPTLKLLNESGDELAFSDDVNWLRNSFVTDQTVPENSSDTSFDRDPALFNITLTEGTYYLEVATAEAGIGQPASNGDIYWLVTSLQPLGVQDLIGDVNLDGVVDFLDISPFIAILAANGFQAEADINQDGTVNFLDIAPFIVILSSQ